MSNLAKMMKQAQQLQKQMAKAQEEIAVMERTFAMSGAIEVTARGDNTITKVRIDPKAVDPQDVEGLEDLVLSCVNGALAAVHKETEERMGALTSGLNIPGLM